MFIEDRHHQPSQPSIILYPFYTYNACTTTGIALPKSIREILGHVLKLVEYDVMGQPVDTLYEIVLAYITTASSDHSLRFKEVEK